MCDSGHQVATAAIDGSHGRVVYWFNPKRRTFLGRRNEGSRCARCPTVRNCSREQVALRGSARAKAQEDAIEISAGRSTDLTSSFHPSFRTDDLQTAYRLTPPTPIYRVDGREFSPQYTHTHTHHVPAHRSSGSPHRDRTLSHQASSFHTFPHSTFSSAINPFPAPFPFKGNSAFHADARLRARRRP